VGADRVLHVIRLLKSEIRAGGWPSAPRRHRPAHQVLHRLLYRRNSGRSRLTSRAPLISRASWFWAGIALASSSFFPTSSGSSATTSSPTTSFSTSTRATSAKAAPTGFLLDQFRICVNLFATPLWLAGLVAFLRNRRYRMLAWMYLVPLALFFFGKGRGYYMAAGLSHAARHGRHQRIASAGSRSCPRWGRRTALEAVFLRRIRHLRRIHHRHHHSARTQRPTPRLRPQAQRRPARRDLAGTSWFAPSPQIRDSLPPDEQATSASQQLATTASRAQSKSSAPPTVCRSPSAPPTPPGCADIRRRSPPPSSSLEMIRERANALFTSCRVAGHNGNSEGIKNEESEYHPDIFVCGPPAPALARASLPTRHSRRSLCT
jgi:hypothetical protein